MELKIFDEINAIKNDYEMMFKKNTKYSIYLKSAKYIYVIKFINIKTY